MKYFIIKFGSAGATNLAVAVATTPTKYKGHRFNASGGSHQLYSGVRRPIDPALPKSWENSQYVTIDKPFTAWPQENVLQELNRDEYIRDAVARSLKSCYQATGPKAHEQVLEELEEIEKRAQGIKNAI